MLSNITTIPMTMPDILLAGLPGIVFRTHTVTLTVKLSIPDTFLTVELSWTVTDITLIVTDPHKF
jgi:hypothetical protein